MYTLLKYYLPTILGKIDTYLSINVGHNAMYQYIV